MQLTFLGATGTVTGSKYLVGAGDRRILVDCGLFLGLKQLRLKNWEPLPVDPASVDAYAELLDWLDHFEAAPRQIFVTHGEPVAADALRHRIEERKGWRCKVPDYREEVDLN